MSAHLFLENLVAEYERDAARAFVESVAQPIEDEDDEQDWLLVGEGRQKGTVAPRDRIVYLHKARWLSRFQQHVKQALRLYRSYIVGRGFEITVRPRDKTRKLTDQDEKVRQSHDRAWEDFLRANRPSWTPREYANRYWRDGETFAEVLDRDGEPPEFRFHDPELIDDPQQPELQGIVTANGDPRKPTTYLLMNPQTQKRERDIPAEAMFHVKIDSDSTEKRGITRFASTVDLTKQLKGLMQSSVLHAILQTNVVMQRKIKGGPNAVTSHLDNRKTSSTAYPEGTVRREKIRPGTIVNTNDSVDIEFKHPDLKAADPSPIAKLLIAGISAATGWPYYAIAADSSDSNFSATLVQESPVVMMVHEEQQFFWEHFELVWRHVMERAVRTGIVKARNRLSVEKFFEEYEAVVRFPSIVHRDRLKETQANNILVMARAISRTEMARRDGADADVMRREIEEEDESDIALGMQGDITTMNPTQQGKRANQPANQGTGTNQGDGGKPNSPDPRSLS